VTAAEVALELEVSERTARRDLDALAMGGVPVLPDDLVDAPPSPGDR
jgi:predicted DNA-binding transcriptional regulator YafY